MVSGFEIKPVTTANVAVLHWEKKKKFFFLISISHDLVMCGNDRLLYVKQVWRILKAEQCAYCELLGKILHICISGGKEFTNADHYIVFSI